MMLPLVWLTPLCLLTQGCTQLQGTIEGFLDSAAETDTETDPISLTRDVGFSGYVNSIALNPTTGFAYFGGGFGSANLGYANRMALVNSDGSINKSFSTGTGPNGYIQNAALQADGKSIIIGGFSTYNGVSANKIARVNTDGSLDTSFASVAIDNSIYSVAIQADGKILIAGSFTSYDGTPALSIARLNTDGTFDSSFDPGTGPDSYISVVIVQNDGKILIGGNFLNYNGSGAVRVARLNSDGSIDNSFNTATGANNVVTVMGILSTDQIVIGGLFTQYKGTAVGRLALLNTNASLDVSFDTSVGSSNSVNALAVQSDDKVLIGGGMTSYNGTGVGYFLRVNTDGSLDTSFDTSVGLDGSPSSIKIQSDGKIVVGGGFIQYNSSRAYYLARINTDGSIDTGFDTYVGANNSIDAVLLRTDGKIIICGGITRYDGNKSGRLAKIANSGAYSTSFDTSDGADSAINSVAIQQSPSKVLIGGYFRNYNGAPANYLARLNINGTLDTDFDTSVGPNNPVNVVVSLSSGKVLIGGEFTLYNGVAANYLALINADGSRDTSFDTFSGGFDGFVRAITVQSDGKILVGGSFTSYHGLAADRILRLNANGSRDTSFIPPSGANNHIRTIAVQDDGKILIGGDFTTYGGSSAVRLARLNSDGSLDTGFDTSTGANAAVYTIAVASNGSIFVGGDFSSYEGTTVGFLVQLDSNGDVDATLNTSVGFNSTVYSLALQSDGKIIVGGYFDTYNAVSSFYGARLLANGTLDTTF